RTWDAAAKADCALIIVDDTVGISESDRGIAARLPSGVRRIIVHNKIDLSGQASRVERDAGEAHVYLSAKTGEGVELLESAILEAAGWRESLPVQFLARERHGVALTAAAARLRAAAPVL